jgi:hypothetical protein
MQSAPISQRAPIDTDSLRTFLESIRSFAGPALILESASIQRLYHYTDLGGLNGIISANDLWLTHLRFSNDDEELAHGQRVAKQAITTVKQGATEEKIAYLTEVESMLNEPQADGVYICCFCSEDNLLSQWRGYGANGAGVSIELNPAEFEHLTGPDCPHGLLRLWKVFYDEEQQRGIIFSALEFSWGHQTHLSISKRAQNAADAIQFFIPTFKNQDFADEKEWRLIFTPRLGANIQRRFRPARNMLVPYYTLQSLGWANRPLPVTGLCIGPSTHKLLNAQSAQMLLLQSSYMEVPVAISQTPYRG